VHEMTNYSIIDIQKCLYDLAVYISKNLSPNRLENFDIENIMHVRIYEKISYLQSL